MLPPVAGSPPSPGGTMGTGLSRLSSGTILKHRLQVNLGILKRRGTAAVTEPPDGLSIGELARRTEVPAATLRSWEDRYGFPRPHRLAGGHRRYDQGDIGLIEAVIRLRAAGMSLHAAFQRQRFFHQSQRRWNELARTARVVVVFADFGEPAAENRPPRGPAPVRVPLPADAPARREWTLVCDSPDYP